MGPAHVLPALCACALALAVQGQEQCSQEDAELKTKAACAMQVRVGAESGSAAEVAAVAEEEADDAEEEGAEAEEADALGAVKQDLDVPYGDDPLQVSDIYWPKKKDGSPWQTVIMFHGKGSSKKKYRQYCRKVAKTNRVCVAGEYRPEPGLKHVGPDEQSLGKWVYDNAEKYKIDTQRIVMGGYSKGGLGINDWLWKKEGIKYYHEYLSGVVIVSGIGNESVNAAANVSAEDLPHILLMCSTDDWCHPHSGRLNQTMHDHGAGSKVMYTEWEDAGHWIRGEDPDGYYAALFDFLDALAGK